MAGASGDAGKTTVTLGLIRALRARGLRVHPFKKGPDFIDPAWLSRAAGVATRNLDVRLCGEDNVRSVFAEHASADGISIIEGNRGLFDGGDAQGTHSTASLARLLRAPVILVVNVTKVTRTAAALVVGCQHLEPGTPIVGVVLNRVAGARHRRVVTEAIVQATGLPVLGALPRAESEAIPNRHLGLLTPQEHGSADRALDAVEAMIAGELDLDRVVELARAAPWMADPPPRRSTSVTGGHPRIGVLQDAAFTFYYPDNLEALERAGGRVVPVSALGDVELPPVDALYVGGGFPETHAEQLAGNGALLASIRERVSRGLPVYAECGGLMYLSRLLRTGDRGYELVGALPVETQMQAAPVGHGYVEATVEGENAFYPRGTKIVGHEFHYSRVVSGLEGVDLAFRMGRGAGVDGGKGEGLRRGNVLATYVHVHAVGMSAWAEGVVRAAEGFANEAKRG